MHNNVAVLLQCCSCARQTSAWAENVGIRLSLSVFTIVLFFVFLKWAHEFYRPSSLTGEPTVGRARRSEENGWEGVGSVSDS